MKAITALWIITMAFAAGAALDQDRRVLADSVSTRVVIYVDDNAPADPGPIDATVGDPAEDGTSGHPFDSIQEAIEVAGDGASILVRPGLYHENIDLLGKRIRLTGADPNDPARNPYPVIAGLAGGPVVSFTHAEDPNCQVTGFVITQGQGPYAEAITCSKSSPTLSHCLIVGNRATGPTGSAVVCTDSHAVFSHCTIADNNGGLQGAGICLVNSNVVLTNSIVWDNTPQAILVSGTSQPSITYTDVAGAWSGLGNIQTDPLFAKPGYWANAEDPSVVVRPENPMAVWIDGDYHLRSRAGRWDPATSAWVQDDRTSPCIDAGDPTTPVGYEPLPNGSVPNVGAYGATTQASRSYSPSNVGCLADAALKAAVEDALHISNPTASDMLGLTELDGSYRGVADLTGLEYATNLQTLDLCHNSLWKVSSISTLCHLKWLSLNNNRLTDISALAGMPDLEYFDMHDNQIADISVLAGLSHLDTLLLYRNRVSNVSALSGLHYVSTLYLGENPLSDISPIAGLTSLVYLSFLQAPLNEQACQVYIPQIRANNPGITIVYHPCIPPALAISSAPGGSVTSPGEGEFSYPWGQLVLIEAKANPGFVFSNWSGTYYSSSNPTFITMNQDHQIRANFTKTP